VALTPILRKLRVPAAVLTLATFLGLFFLMTTDAGAYADGLPTKQFVHNAACDGDPDTPEGLHPAGPADDEFDQADWVRALITLAVEVSGLVL